MITVSQGGFVLPASDRISGPSTLCRGPIIFTTASVYPATVATASQRGHSVHPLPITDNHEGHMPTEVDSEAKEDMAQGN